MNQLADLSKSNGEQSTFHLGLHQGRSGPHGQGDRAVRRAGMGEGTGDRIREEMLKKGLTPSERAFLNLGRKGKAREIELMEFGNR